MTNRTVYSGLMALTLLGGLIASLPGNAQGNSHKDRDWHDNGERRGNEHGNRNHRDGWNDHNDRRDDHKERGEHDNRNNRNRRDNRIHQYNSGWSESHRQDWIAQHRNESRNEWRNIATGSGGGGLLSILLHDATLNFSGSSGARYPLNKYEQDRRSDRREDRLRAEYFNRPYFYRDGVRYERRLVNRDGQRYYQFARR